MRKVLWSGSLKHRGASLTAPHPPSYSFKPPAEHPNQRRAAHGAPFYNLQAAQMVVSAVCQQATWDRVLEEIRHRDWSGMPLISLWKSSCWGVMSYSTHRDIFNKWLLSVHCSAFGESVRRKSATFLRQKCRSGIKLTFCSSLHL